MSASTSHGESPQRGRPATPEWRAWNSMIDRCRNNRNSAYERYGGRGIRVCARWLGRGTGFPRFLADVGRRPSPSHSLDRIDNERGYEPSNVRWATVAEQNRNRRCSRLISAFGETKALGEWASDSRCS